MRALQFDEAIAGQTWVARALGYGRELPPLEAPWPVWLQGSDPDTDVWMPDAYSGQLVAGEMFIHASAAIARAAAGDTSPAAAVAPPTVVRVEQICSHTSYRLSLDAGQAKQIYAANRQRGYSMIVNTGTVQVFIAYGTEADATGFPLAPNGVGFHELVNGTSSSLSVFCPAAGASVHVIPGLFDPPH